MKRFALFLAVLFGLSISAQNYELSTLRIGEYKLYMKKSDAQEIADKVFKNFSDYSKKTKVDYYGAEIELAGDRYYMNDTVKEVEVILQLSTKSSKFRTKSGMGVGNTRQELINAYSNYPNFNMQKSWDEENVSYFRLLDMDAFTELSFKIENDKVVEVMVYVNEGEC